MDHSMTNILKVLYKEKPGKEEPNPIRWMTVTNIRKVSKTLSNRSPRKKRRT